MYYWEMLFIVVANFTARDQLYHFYHYDAEVYPKISALVKLARKLDTYNERNQETSFVSYFSQKGFRQLCEIKEHSERKLG